MSSHHERIKNDPRWKAARAECLDRDDHACIECGATETLEADHIAPLAQYPDLAFEVDNLRTLCKPCHTARHQAGAEGDGLVRNTWINPDYAELEAIL